VLKISNLAAKLDETEGEEKMGQQGLSTNELRFDNCRLHREAVPGKLNDGYRIAIAELAGGKIGIGSMALGMGING